MAVLSGETFPTITTPSSATLIPTLVSASTQVVPDDDLLEEFFLAQHHGFFVLVVVVRVHFLDGRHSVELGHPTLFNYLNNIGNIGGSE